MYNENIILPCSSLLSGTQPSSAMAYDWRVKTGNAPYQHSWWHSQAHPAVGGFSTAVEDKFEGGFPVQ